MNHSNHHNPGDKSRKGTEAEARGEGNQGKPVFLRWSGGLELGLVTRDEGTDASILKHTACMPKGTDRRNLTKKRTTKIGKGAATGIKPMNEKREVGGQWKKCLYAGRESRPASLGGPRGRPTTLA